MHRARIPGDVHRFPMGGLPPDSPAQQRLKEKMKQWLPSQRLIKHCQQMENPTKRGRNSIGMWFTYEEGGYQTIGYGHELSREENTNGLEIDGLTFFAKKGLSDTQIQRLLEIDLAMACLYAQRVVAEVCDGPLNGKHTWENMHPRCQEVCIDYTYKMGWNFFQEYPAFLKALANGDARMALAQSNRHFRSVDGKIMKLSKRAAAIKNMLIEVNGGPLRLGRESGKADKLKTGNPCPAKLHWSTLSRPLTLALSNDGNSAFQSQVSFSPQKKHGFRFTEQLDQDDHTLPPSRKTVLPADKFYQCPTKQNKLSFHPLNASSERQIRGSRLDFQSTNHGLFRKSASGGCPKGFALDD